LLDASKFPAKCHNLNYLFSYFLFMVLPANWLVLVISGLLSGIMAGFLGVGGGTVLVPIQVALGYSPLQAVATSSLAIVITSISGTVQNWRMGYFRFKPIIMLGIPAILTSKVGVELAELTKRYKQGSGFLLIGFGVLLLLNIYLVDLRQKLVKQEVKTTSKSNPVVSRVITGGAAGILSSLFGVGGGVIMVPLQMLLLAEPIKVAIQTSLGVIVITAIASTIQHAANGNIAWAEGTILGFGGLIGAQISTRFLPKLPDYVVSIAFRSLLAILSIYIFWQGWQRL
jgi:uncharacterized protein